MESWTTRTSGTKVPANHFESRFRWWKCGLLGTEIRFNGYVDRDNLPFAAAGGGLVGGAEIACSAFLIKGGAVFTFTEMVVFEVEVGDEADGKATISVSGETNGTWSYPGGITAT